jgi:hypothetical protein
MTCSQIGTREDRDIELINILGEMALWLARIALLILECIQRCFATKLLYYVDTLTGEKGISVKVSA